MTAPVAARLADVLDGSAAPAVRRLGAATAAHAAVRSARARGLRPALVDGLLAGSKATILEALGDAVGAPRFWGRNWDALADVLGDPGLSPDADVLVWSSPSVLLDLAPTAYAVLLDVLGEAVRYRAGTEDPLVVVLCDVRPLPGTAPLTT